MRSLVMTRCGVWIKRGTRTLLPIAGISFLLSASPVFAAIDYDTILRDRLESVRELLDRRQAHRSMLTTKIERLSSRLDRLLSDREFALSALSDKTDSARALERELDRLLPRLTPRLNFLDRVRKEGARAIAGLAHLERGADLEERSRSRLLATQAPSIEQMRQASTAVRLLRRAPNTMTARHRDVDFQIPLLAASVSRLDLQQSQLQRRRDAAVRDLANLTVEIDRLTAQEHRLARNMIARGLEATDGTDVGKSKAVLPNRRTIGKSAIANADVRGIALRRTQLTPVARPLDQARAKSQRPSVAGVASKDAVLSARSQAPALLAGRSSNENWSADIASPDAVAAGSSTTARVAPGLIDQDQALTPILEAIGHITANGERSRNDLRIEIAARPKQRVAAPEGGRVAFAGDFRSYGLLLIIEHGNGYHTLLWGFSTLDIELGDNVRAGQIVGILNDGPSPKLYVELRRNGQLVSPEVWLAASNSGVKG